MSYERYGGPSFIDIKEWILKHLGRPGHEDGGLEMLLKYVEVALDYQE